MNKDKLYIITRTIMWCVACGMGAYFLRNEHPYGAAVSAVLFFGFIWQGWSWWKDCEATEQCNQPCDCCDGLNEIREDKENES